MTRTVDKDAVGCAFFILCITGMFASIGYVERMVDMKRKACFHQCSVQGFYTSDYSYFREECKCLTAEDVLKAP